MMPQILWLGMSPFIGKFWTSNIITQCCDPGAGFENTHIRSSLLACVTLNPFGNME